MTGLRYTVLLRNNATGEVREIAGNPGGWGEDADYLWTEGNFACDCNRQLLFDGCRVGEPTCGDSAFTAICAKLEDGTVVALDDASDALASLGFGGGWR